MASVQETVFRERAPCPQISVLGLILTCENMSSCMPFVRSLMLLRWRKITILFLLTYLLWL